MTHFLPRDDLQRFDGVLLDCRFSLIDSRAGDREYLAGHIPGARRLDLARHMSSRPGTHGGRHPLPQTLTFAAVLARLGIGKNTDVVCYDDSRHAFAARCWWMMRALGYRAPRLLEGGYQAWSDKHEVVEKGEAAADAGPVPDVPDAWPLCCNREQLAVLQANGAQLVDAREAVRYRGEHEPIDPVAGHIPGAANVPWQDMLDEQGRFLTPAGLEGRWLELAKKEPLVVYCGSGVSACVDLLALDILGRQDAWLYAGSWSDWCSYL